MTLTPITWTIAALMGLGFIVNITVFWFKKEEMSPMQMVYILSAQLFIFTIIVTVLLNYLYNEGILS